MGGAARVWLPHCGMPPHATAGEVILQGGVNDGLNGVFLAWVTDVDVFIFDEGSAGEGEGDGAGVTFVGAGGSGSPATGSRPSRRSLMARSPPGSLFPLQVHLVRQNI